jgi:hypothetical protein
MAQTSRCASSPVFDPEISQKMAAAFEAAWGDLRAVGHVAAAPFYAAETRARLAKHIFELAQSGVHDETELVSEALAAILREGGTRKEPAGNDGEQQG